MATPLRPVWLIIQTLCTLVLNRACVRACVARRAVQNWSDLVTDVRSFVRVSFAFLASSADIHSFYEYLKLFVGCCLFRMLISLLKVCAGSFPAECFDTAVQDL